MNKYELELVYLMQKYPSIYEILGDLNYVKILEALETGSKTFPQLEEITMLKANVLEQYLDFLLHNQFIDVLHLPNRVEYVLTSFGKKVLELKKKALSSM